MSNRSELLAAIRARLGGKALLWLGPRGEDGSLFHSELSAAAPFSITAAGHAPASQCLEELVGARPDLECYDIDRDISPELAALQSQLVTQLRRPSVLVPYRASHWLDDVRYAASGSSVLCAHHSDIMRFEYKPWVESSLARMGVRTIPWKYVNVNDRATWPDIDGRVVIRPSRSSGGMGIHVADSLADASRSAGSAPKLVAVAAFKDEAVPLNIASVVWRDGVTVHPVSVQLVGTPELTPFPLGYCGNDFAAVAALPLAVIDEAEVLTRRVGAWLAAQGYLGAYGVDALVHDGRVLFVECNARLQGSTYRTSLLSARSAQPCPALDHVAAWLHVPFPRNRGPIRDRVGEMTQAQVIVHNVAGTVAAPTRACVGALGLVEGVDTVELASPVPVRPGGVLARIVFNQSVTTASLRVVRPTLLAAIQSALGSAAE